MRRRRWLLSKAKKEKRPKRLSITDWRKSEAETMVGLRRRGCLPSLFTRTRCERLTVRVRGGAGGEFCPLRVVIYWCCLLLFLGCEPESPEAQSGPRPNEGLPEVRLFIDDTVITVEVADTDRTRQVGLMFRDSLPADQGMLFVFEDSEYRTFHMRNVRFPLDIAFIRADGAIDEIKRMKTASLERTYSQHKVKYALEMNEGWFESHGIEPGDRLDLSPVLAP
jgi:uncharacterized membrane protein (UPF0127 family)